MSSGGGVVTGVLYELYDKLFLFIWCQLFHEHCSQNAEENHHEEIDIFESQKFKDQPALGPRGRFLPFTKSYHIERFCVPAVQKL